MEPNGLYSVENNLIISKILTLAILAAEKKQSIPWDTLSSIRKSPYKYVHFYTFNGCQKLLLLWASVGVEKLLLEKHLQTF